ncbi:hypothetical protein R1flu_002869 [Riccia fluitans]|uniref:Myb-like domain-containing protein n=1 Tax=Riccia fluitans TaxID=41844 RepID=A0ABD1Y7C8_9MARC
MNGKQRLQADGDNGDASVKKRKGGQEKEKMAMDRRIWTPKEETELVKILQEHRARGRIIPVTSRSATYWLELMTILYPGDNGVHERRLYDKVRRMLQRYAEIRQLLQGKNDVIWKSAHEKMLFDSWEKIFDDETVQTITNGNKRAPAAKPAKDSITSSVKVVDQSALSSEDEEEAEVRILVSAKAVPPAKVRALVPPSSERDEEEDEEEESSPDKGRPKVKAEVEGRQEKVENGSTKRRRVSGEESVLDVKSLKAELMDFVHKLRNDCMTELAEVKSQLMSPARLQLARKRQELFMEELALQEKELEINRRYCRSQKDALKP